MEESLRNNPLLKEMDAEKMQFILNFAQKDKPKNINEAMPFLLSNMNLAKNQNIHFTKPEIQLIAQILTKDLPQKEKDKVNRIMTMMLK